MFFIRSKIRMTNKRQLSVFMNPAKKLVYKDKPDIYM